MVHAFAGGGGAETDTCWERVGRQMHEGGAHGESIETTDTLPQVISQHRTGPRALSHSFGFRCRESLEHIRQSRPYSGRGLSRFQYERLENR